MEACVKEGVDIDALIGERFDLGLYMNSTYPRRAREALVERMLEDQAFAKGAFLYTMLDMDFAYGFRTSVGLIDELSPVMLEYVPGAEPEDYLEQAFGLDCDEIIDAYYWAYGTCVANS